jgi:hypothetical protein
MRRIVMTVVCSVLIQWAFPTQAFAWWEFIEELSGPGRFYGWDVDLRLFCLADKVDPSRADKNAPDVEKVGPSVGAVVSACRIKTGFSRRLAVNLGARFLWADDNPRFANGQRISLTTLEPSVSFNLFSKHPTRDFVDYGFGAGVYWFSSTEFTSFNGAFIEPVRFEFHTTTDMKQKHKWAAAIPVVRVGVLMFPAGFDTASFAAAPDVPARISRDWAFNAGVFFDLEGLFN